MTKEQQRIKQLLINVRENHGNENYLILIPKKFSKKVYAYGGMKYDLELILEYLEELKKDNESLASSGLTYAMISLYGKCFTDASKDGFPKLEPKEIFRNKEDLLIDHNYLMELRHKFIAHRRWIEDEIGIAYLAVKKTNNKKVELKFRQIKLSSFSKEKLSDFENVFHFVAEVVEKKLRKSAGKLYDRLIKTYSKEQFEKLMFNNTNLDLE